MEEANKKQHSITLNKAIKIFAILTALFFLFAIVGSYGTFRIIEKYVDSGLGSEDFTKQDIFMYNLFYRLQNIGRFFIIFCIVTVNLLMIYLFKHRANVIQKIKHIKITKKQIISVGVILLAIFAYVGITNKEQEPEMTPTERAIYNEVYDYAIRYYEEKTVFVFNEEQVNIKIPTMELVSDDEEEQKYKIYGKFTGQDKFGEEFDSEFICTCVIDDSEEIDVFVYDFDLRSNLLRKME